MAKKHNRDDFEDRSKEYREFRWNMGVGAAQDIDMVEYYQVGRKVVPVAVIELTRRDPPPHIPDPPPSYFRRVVQTYAANGKDKPILTFAAMLGVQAYVVVHEEGMKRLWVYNLSTKGDWSSPLTKNEYKEWLARLYEKKRNGEVA